MRGLRHPYRWGRDHPLVVDTLFAAVLAGLGLLSEIFSETSTAPEYVREPDLRSILLTLAATVPLAVRRRYPLAVYIPVFVAANVYYTLQYPGGGPMLGLVVTLYGVAAHSRRRTAAYTLACSLVAGVVGAIFFPTEEESLASVIAFTGILVASWLIGDNIRVRRAYVAAVEDRAEQLEREQDAQARRAVLEERSRIARELHDIVAHSMSVMVVQAGAARRTLDRDPARAVEAMSHIESTGRDALAEMRRVVAVLRSDGDGAADRDREQGEPIDSPRGEPLDRDDLVPQPRLDELPALLDQCREVGLQVDIHVTGTQRPLPSGVELTVYRIVQEALTNTIRHAGQARAEVAVCFGDDRVTVSVVDDGRGASVAADGSTPTPPGHGLAGMHERVALYGGHVTAGPRAGGGFAVNAEIPLPDHAHASRGAVGPARLLTGWWAS